MIIWGDIGLKKGYDRLQIQACGVFMNQSIYRFVANGKVVDASCRDAQFSRHNKVALLYFFT